MDVKIKKHSVVIGGRHDTSISIESEFWSCLKDIADRENISINKLVTQIDETRQGALSSAIRLFILRDFKKQINKE